MLYRYGCARRPQNFVRAFRSCLTPQDSPTINANLAMSAWGRGARLRVVFLVRPAEETCRRFGTNISPPRDGHPPDRYYYNTVDRLIFLHPTDMVEITVA
jgi:hypothetical protein